MQIKLIPSKFKEAVDVRAENPHFYSYYVISNQHFHVPSNILINIVIKLKNFLMSYSSW